MKRDKIKVPGELFMILGLLLISLSISIMGKLGFGISTIASLPYNLNLVIPEVSFGVWNFLFQSMLYVVMIFITKRVKKVHAISFLMCVIFAFLLDGTKMLVGAMPEELYLRVIIFAVMFIVMSLGIALMMTSKVPLMIVDMFSNNLSAYYQTSFRRIKTILDVCLLASSAAAGMIFLGNLGGVGIGTIIMAFITGALVQAFGQRLNNKLDIQPYFNRFKANRSITAEGEGSDDL